MRRPEVLVLGGGGTLGEAWLRSLLAGLEAGTGWDLRRCDAFVGTSAGSIVASVLAAGRRPEAARGVAEEWERATAAAVGGDDDEPDAVAGAGGGPRARSRSCGGPSSRSAAASTAASASRPSISGRALASRA